MRGKNLISILILAVLIFPIVGCSPTATTTPAAPTVASAPTQQPLKVALLMSGPINDGGWNQSGYEGLMLIKDKYSAEVSYSENVVEADILELIRSYAKQGNNIIFGHGYEYGEALQTVAAEYPDLYFIQIAGYETNGKNLGAIESGDAGTLGYPAGIAAALLTKTNKIGLVGAVDIPTVTNEFLALEQAVKKYNPNASIVTAYTGSWTDVESAREAALAQISTGVDIIVPNGDAANVGVIRAAQEKGAMVIGTQRDQMAVGPDVVMMSVIYPIYNQMVNVVDLIQKGEFKGEFYLLSTADGGILLSDFNQKVPKDIQQQILDGFELLKKGQIQIVLPTAEW